jgi:subtilisin family serine protease
MQLKAVLSAAAVVLAATLLLAGSAGAADGAGSPKLSKEDRAALAEARANGEKQVTMLIAAKPGEMNAVAEGVTGLGGTVRKTEASIDYVRATVPTDKVEAVASLDAVQQASLDILIPLDDPSPDATPTPPGPGTPAENPQLPTRDIGAPQFVAAHPTYDGRGAVIGILDTGIDVLTPELQTGKNSSGGTVRKIIQWKNFNDPFSGLDPSWVNMETQVTVSGGSFTAGGSTYTGVPADGTYRFGVFKESAISASSEYGIDCNPATPAFDAGADLNRNGVCGESFAAIWDTSSDTVRVDSTADKSFAGEKAMKNYDVNYDIGIFGTDNPSTATRETVPFTIQTDGADKFINIGVVGAEHGTHVAGIAAGRHFFGGAMNGAAPEAQIVSVRVCVFGTSCTSAGLIDGMIYAEKQANVDVINMSIGGLPALNDGNNARAILYNRLIDQSKAQMFISAGNSGSGHNTVGDPSIAEKVMSVGAYVHQDTWFNNYGAVSSKVEGLFNFSSRGPREDGGLKPNIVAPGAAISTVPAWEPNFPLVPPLPPGYDLLNGTSMAAPQATGGAALLISAAKQTGAQWKPDQLRQAINSGARYLAGEGAYEQGNGIMQVGAAWDVLKQNVKTVDITSSAPVKTVLSGLLATPNRGPGIYEREGWTPGQTGTRTITFTRTSGGAGGITYNLSWLGSDGTFSSAASISLPRGTPVNLPVTINAGAAGIHSALLRLNDPNTAGVDYTVLNTIVAANQFNAANNFSVASSGSADRPDMATFFYNVEPNTPAFKVDVTSISGRVRILRYSPQGLPIDNTSTEPFQTGGSLSKTLSNPIAGVWEVAVEVSRTSAVAPATFDVTGTVLGVDISPTSWTIDPATVGTTYTNMFTFTNRFGSFTGGAVGTALGGAGANHATIAAGGAQQIYEVTVPAGSTRIASQIGNASDSRADLDLFLFDCTTGTCVQRASSTGASANEFVSFNNPAAGLWKILVDPFAVPAGSTTYDETDVISNPAFGSVIVTDPAAPHANGSTWSAPASVTAATAPAAGRFLQGFVQVRSGSTVLGSAEVDLKNVH